MTGITVLEGLAIEDADGSVISKVSLEASQYLFNSKSNTTRYGDRSVIDMSRAKRSMSRTPCTDDFKRDDAVKPRREGIAIEDKITINVSTIIISISVKAESKLRELLRFLNPVGNVSVIPITPLFAILAQ